MAYCQQKETKIIFASQFFADKRNRETI